MILKYHTSAEMATAIIGNDRTGKSKLAVDMVAEKKFVVFTSILRDYPFVDAVCVHSDLKDLTRIVQQRNKWHPQDQDITVIFDVTEGMPVTSVLHSAMDCNAITVIIVCSSMDLLPDDMIERIHTWKFTSTVKPNDAFMHYHPYLDTSKPPFRKPTPSA